MSKQNKAKAEEGTWIRKAETEDYREKQGQEGLATATIASSLDCYQASLITTFHQQTCWKTLSADVYSSL